ncbi:MAG: type II secretion system F family protein [Eubacteriales bacterium]|nr:type II secretion system F family protein [Eubacteriales bacterium]
MLSSIIKKKKSENTKHIKNVNARRYKEPDYNDYKMPFTEKLFYTAIAGAAIIAAAYVFYKDIYISLLLCPISLFYPGIKRKSIIKKRKEELNVQLKDMLYSLASSVSAGKPIERAFRELPDDLELLYPDENSLIRKEAALIAGKLDMNETIESALESMSERSHLDDVKSFSEVFGICKRSGGNITDVIRNTTNIINDRIEIWQEIETILAERRFEQKVLNILPFLMMLILTYASGDYMEPVFTTPAGRVAVTASLLLLAAASWLSGKIANIKI